MTYAHTYIHTDTHMNIREHIYREEERVIQERDLRGKKEIQRLLTVRMNKNRLIECIKYFIKQLR